MNKPLSITLLVTSLTLAACADGAGEPGEAETGGNASQQLETGSGGKGDGATALSKDTRILNCQLEYEAFDPAFAVRHAAELETSFGTIENEGAKAGDGAYTLRVRTNPKPPYNLSFIIQIIDESRHGAISYIVLPRPHVGGAFLFELGADIPPATFPAEGTQSYDNLRAYCSIRMP
jgi:hypothetical protein